MKKIAIVLSFVLSVFIISSCANNNPNNPTDQTDNSTKITLAQRAGNYEGDMSGTKLIMVFDNQGQVTKIDFGGLDFSTIGEMPVKVGDPNSTAKNYDFDVQMKNNGGTVNVKVNFDSDTEVTGGKAYVTIIQGQPAQEVIITKVS
ncbi:hypothetical protein E6A50_07075 [Brachyspira hampsonii]|nr:hypothetical protein [Brachyspira hampsonii]